MPYRPPQNIALKALQLKNAGSPFETDEEWTRRQKVETAEERYKAIVETSRDECGKMYREQQEAWKRLMDDLRPPSQPRFEAPNGKGIVYGGNTDPIEGRQPTAEEALKRGFVWAWHSHLVGYAWIYHPELDPSDPAKMKAAREAIWTRALSRLVDVAKSLEGSSPNVALAIFEITSAEEDAERIGQLDELREHADYIKAMKLLMELLEDRARPPLRPALPVVNIKPTAAESQLEKSESIIAKPGLVDAILADHDCQLISIVKRLNALGFQATTYGGKPSQAAQARSLAIGDPVTGGVDGRVFYNNGGTFGEAVDLTYDDVFGVTTFRNAVFLTAFLPAASAAMDGKQLIEDAGVGQFNLIYYAGGRRFRLVGVFF